MLWFGSQMFMFVAPSVQVELLVFAWPLTLVASDRAGGRLGVAERHQRRQVVHQRLVVSGNS